MKACLQSERRRTTDAKEFVLPLFSFLSSSSSSFERESRNYTAAKCGIWCDSILHKLSLLISITLYLSYELCVCGNYAIPLIPYFPSSSSLQQQIDIFDAASDCLLQSVYPLFTRLVSFLCDSPTKTNLVVLVFSCYFTFPFLCYDKIVVSVFSDNASDSSIPSIHIVFVYCLHVRNSFPLDVILCVILREDVSYLACMIVWFITWTDWILFSTHLCRLFLQ